MLRIQAMCSEGSPAIGVDQLATNACGGEKVETQEDDNIVGNGFSKTMDNLANEVEIGCSARNT